MTTAAPAPPTAPDSEESAESITAPVSALGGASVGDTVTFTIDSIDGGTASLSPVEDQESDEGSGGSAISQASKMFNGGK